MKQGVSSLFVLVVRKKYHEIVNINCTFSIKKLHIYGHLLHIILYWGEGGAETLRVLVGTKKA